MNVIRFDCDSTYDPAAPFVDFEIEHPPSGQWRPLEDFSENIFLCFFPEQGYSYRLLLL